MAQKIEFKFNPEKFSDFLNKLRDLTQINDIIKIKFDTQDLIIYSTIQNESQVLAMKSYRLLTQEYFIGFESTGTFDLVVLSANKFVKNLQFFLDSKEIKIQIQYKLHEDILQIRQATISKQKLKISVIGGETFKIKQINKNFLEKILDVNKSKWSFSVDSDDFMDVKKLSSINSEEKYLNINVEDGLVKFNEVGKWELSVDKVTTDIKNCNIIFNKKFLSNIQANLDKVTFMIFPTFILVNEENSNFMISFEQDFED